MNFINSSDSRVISLWTGWPGNQALIPDRGIGFSLLHSIQADSEALPSPFLSTSGSFVRVKQPSHETDHLSPYGTKAKVLSDVFMVLFLIKHRDNSTFYLPMFGVNVNLDYVVQWVVSVMRNNKVLTGMKAASITDT
jgi:hypothetical protein